MEEDLYRKRKLYHGTSIKNVSIIVKKGFIIDEDSCIWLTDDISRALNYAMGGLVIIDVSDKALKDMNCKIEKPDKFGPDIVRCCKWNNKLVDITGWIEVAARKEGERKAIAPIEFIEEVIDELTHEVQKLKTGDFSD